MADPKKSPEPAAPQSPEMAALVAQVAELTAQLASVQKSLAVERPMATPLRVQQEREEWFEKIKEELGHTCDKRTQDEVDRRWAAETKQRWRVAICAIESGKIVRDQLALAIPARSKEEAKGRYDDVCGIRGVDPDTHRYEITEVKQAA